MAYISSSGTIEPSPPWSLSRLIGLFWAFLNFIVMFFKTLIDPDMNRKGSQYTRDYRPGPGPPRPPRRKLGGFGSGGFGQLDCSSMGGG
ncbi:selenoprotein K [Anabrus simplex]|uniref:selenoprotein K n=1 Tax=Anabrus simplex TaxID=316456 RepID=UPI0034DCF8C0